MWRSCAIRLALCILAIGCAQAAPVACPARISDAGVKHVLFTASLFDGPPERMVDLMPDDVGTMGRWLLDDIDPYLVCRYKGTQKTVTYHVKATRVCEGSKKPFRVYCK